MSLPTIRECTPQDIPQIMELQRAYQRAYPHAAVIPGEAYLSPGFEAGRNIPCAFDDEDSLLGYAPLLPVPAEQQEAPHTAWAEVKTDPSLGPWPLAKKFLFEHLLSAAGNNKEAVVIVYSRFVASRKSHIGAKLLVNYGYKNVYRYPAGVTGWGESGYSLKK